MKKDELSKKLTLILMYLNRIVEKDRFLDKDITYSFKGYDFNDINSLSDENYIIDNGYKSKTIYLTDKGIEKAKELLK